ncbi:unnamed protein product [Toxocara canis]|uniref:Uncharacterized protein n=1 Tax=Toxocara canis TaxID=6265 RepID=A0A183V1L3_TOXCA|nr:unnamed protein product [Toxocara canis]
MGFSSVTPYGCCFAHPSRVQAAHAFVSDLPQPKKCERNAEKLDAQRSEMLNVLWAETMAQSEHEWAQTANHKLEMYERALLASCSAPTVRTSTYSSAFMHSFSLITTIAMGYVVWERASGEAMLKTCSLIRSCKKRPVSPIYSALHALH